MPVHFNAINHLYRSDDFKFANKFIIDISSEEERSKWLDIFFKINSIMNRKRSFISDNFASILNSLISDIVNYPKEQADLVSFRLKCQERLNKLSRYEEADNPEYYEVRLSEARQQMEDATRRISEIEELGKNMLLNLEDKAHDLDERYKEAFIGAELEHQQKELDKSNSSFWNANNFWVFATFVSFIILGIVLCYILHDFCFELSCFNTDSLASFNKICSDCGKHVLYFEISKAILYRILVISALFYLVSFCIKNYNAGMHNKVIDAHRANALGSALRLIGKANEAKAKDEILTLAAQAIFAYQKTGHLNKEAEPSNPNPIIERFVDKTDNLK